MRAGQWGFKFPAGGGRLGGMLGTAGGGGERVVSGLGGKFLILPFKILHIAKFFFKNSFSQSHTQRPVRSKYPRELLNHLMSSKRYLYVFTPFTQTKSQTGQTKNQSCKK